MVAVPQRSRSTRRAHLRNERLDAAMLGVADADHGLLDEVGGVFGDAEARERGHDQRDAAGLAEFQRRLRIAIDEGLLDRGLVRAVRGDDMVQALMQLPQALTEGQVAVALDAAAGDEGELAAFGDDDAPAGLPEAGIETEDA